MIDKRLLTDSITVRLADSENNFRDKVYQEPITVSACRFDRSVTVNGVNKSISRHKVGVVYIYPKFVKVAVDEAWLGALVNDGQRDYTVTGFRENWLNGKVFSYEVEVE